MFRTPGTVLAGDVQKQMRRAVAVRVAGPDHLAEMVPNIIRYLGHAVVSVGYAMRYPAEAVRQAVRFGARARSAAYAEAPRLVPENRSASPSAEQPSALETYFDAHREGPGIWKWRHYFPIYDRHFRHFVGRNMRILEIGIYSGGSPAMWRHYFGAGCQVIGVDIEPACKTYSNEWTRILVGDQADRSFWKRVWTEIPEGVDIIVDDGGHLPSQQIATFEEAFPMVRPGGIYLCEDLLGRHSVFAAYAQGLADRLNDWAGSQTIPDAGHPAGSTSAWQAWVSGVHLYPFVTVVEKRSSPLLGLEAPRQGTEWQPFFDKEKSL